MLLSGDVDDSPIDPNNSNDFHLSGHKAISTSYSTADDNVGQSWTKEGSASSGEVNDELRKAQNPSITLSSPHLHRSHGRELDLADEDEVPLVSDATDSSQVSLCLLFIAGHVYLSNFLG